MTKLTRAQAVTLQVLEELGGWATRSTVYHSGGYAQSLLPLVDLGLVEERDEYPKESVFRLIQPHAVH